MTILFLARRFYPLVGGVEKHVFEISDKLIKKGHRVIVITELSQKLPNSEKLESNGLEIYRINQDDSDSKMQTWREMWRLRNIIRDADIVHCHDVFYWYLPFRFLFPKKPVYTTFHGYESYPVRKRAIQVRKLSEKLSWGNICIGDFIAKWYGTKPTFISYGAVDLSKYKNQNAKFKRESAIFVGRLDNQTGILTYAKAFEKLKEEFSKFEMSAIGDGEFKKKISKKINVLGFQNNSEKYYSKNHFAFVSRYLAILEAFAAKRLVFAVYDNPIKEDYLRMSPFAKYIIIADNAELLKEKVTYYLKHPTEEKKLINNAYKWVEKQSWDTMVELYLKLWRKQK